jgi:hypothetical protein
MPQGQPPSSIIVGNCIACQGLVRVPSTINAQSNVRCPHCQETFAISVLLDQSVPELEIVSGEDSQVESDKQSLYIDKQAGEIKDETGKFVVPSQLAKGARRRGRGKSRRSRSRSSNDRETSSKSRPDEGRRSSSSQSSSQNGASAAASNQGTPVREISFERQSSSSARTPSRASERNSAVEFLKVMAGAALAIPIAYLVVLWGFGQDPLGLGRSIGNSVPFMVPEKYRSDQADAEDTPSTSANEPSLGFDIDQDSDLSNIGKESLDGLLD